MSLSAHCRQRFRDYGLNFFQGDVGITLSHVIQQLAQQATRTLSFFGPKMLLCLRLSRFHDHVMRTAVPLVQTMSMPWRMTS